MNVRRSLLLLSLLCVLCLGFALSCGKATPVAPTGTTLAITANPSRIDLFGTSTITVFGRKANGSNLDPGTEVRFSTDKGSIDGISTIKDGQATATLHGDGSSGTATVTATTGASTMVTTKIQVGQGDVKPTLLVNVNPNNIPVLGKSTVTVIARNADGTAVGAGQSVIVTTDLGTLKPASPLTTDASGIATTTLTAGSQAGTATVTAIVGSSDPKTATLTIRDSAASISLQVDRTSIQSGGDQVVNLTAFVFNAQQQPVNGATVTFSSSKPSLSTSVTTTDASGKATSTLTVKAADLATCEPITVTATTPSGTATPFSSTKTITVTGC
ncbi:MAG TPA: Ig-like domain-containing protein [Thermoanaerobaculia bacterium]|nr:Ig-like domain-containing protein [Thermoanaerobaculia bacterium]